MNQLIILPAATDVLGGTMVSLSLLLKGISICHKNDRVRVLVPSDSFLATYLQTQQQEEFIQPIAANNQAEFIAKSFQWVAKQPKDRVLIVENCLAKEFMSLFIPAAFKLRLSQRSVYFFFHDLALSFNPVGFWLRKFILTVMGATSICNSQFTAKHTRRFIRDIRGILYQPVDSARFNPVPAISAPSELQPILNSNSRIMLTPSRLDKPGIFNDKNLRALIPVLAELKTLGYDYHSVIIGKDTSDNGSHRRNLLAAAAEMGVSDRLTILPPAIDIESYYKCADLVVTLAPREPFGRTVVEAISCGVPVVGSDGGGIGEILSNFAPQWRVNPDEPKTVAETIVRVTEANDTAQLLTKGKKWVEEECGMAEYASRLLKITEIS